MGTFERVVSPRMVRRIIRHHRKIGGFGREAPHERGYVLPAAELDPDDRAELEAPSDGLVRLIADNADNARNRLELEVFAAWEDLRRRGRLPPSAIRERMERLGQAEIDEIRAVLRTQRRLLPPRPGESREGLTWSLFAAYWVELRTFDPEQLTYDLPNLAARHEEVDRLLAEDVPWRLPAAPAHVTAPLPAPPPPPPSAEILALGMRLDAAIGPSVQASPACLTPAPTLWSTLLVLADRRLRHDLRKACWDAERPFERGDVLRFVLSLGARPLVQPLPYVGPVRVLRHLARARARTHATELGDALDAAIARHEVALRDRLRPVVRAALEPAVKVASVVEEVALTKTIDELLDRLAAKGRLDFPTLRDGISRNHTKLSDLRAADVLTDPLLAADRALATSLAGVHRRGEVYRRVLHRASALAFGTPGGRFVTRFALIPAIGAYAVIEALQHTVGLVVHLHLLNPVVFVALALFILGLVNSATVRDLAGRAVTAVGHALRIVLSDLPRWLAARAFFKTVTWRRLWRWLIEPALLAAPLSLLVYLLLAALPPPLHLTLLFAPFVVAVILVNSALGLRLEEAMTDAIVRARRFISEDLLPGLFGWILAVFRALLDAFERALYAVDERLQLRAGTRRRHVVLLAFVAVPWRIVSYIARLYVNLSLEPKVNPVKHFPAVTIGHKLVVPLSLALATSLEPALGATAANTIATIVLFVVPGLFGFLTWELKENWRLYDRNRPSTLRPVVIGSHGETVLRLLRPGFHSGTLPKHFAKLRRAIRRTPGPARERQLAKLAAKRHHLEHDMRTFLERDLLALVVRANADTTLADLAVDHVALASNRIIVRFAQGETFTLEAPAGHIAGLFLPTPSEPIGQLMVAGLHRMAAVEFIREGLRKDGEAWTEGPDELIREPIATATVPILWSDWVAAWQAASRGARQTQPKAKRRA